VTGDEYSFVRAPMAADGGCLEGTGGHLQDLARCPASRQRRQQEGFGQL
jgi:hypothetical protein